MESSLSFTAWPAALGVLYNAAWGEDYELGTNTVDNTIWRLRSKLEPDPKHPTYIKTVFRVGYKIEPTEH
ncbi:winged helix-turn-helix domain-containing protein [Intestinibacillus sp. Marseille-P6563]|uniref:winged helix-turn-helix domain-containing protein n=1 Tax=Intestinibacillus sp. Marseille-P6563 TaxID=2364792 RepID=UPI000F050B3B|nr:winged helix-turn-helix domain-containing protein [Intestinibacillus sp. Marseille-P6563]